MRYTRTVYLKVLNVLFDEVVLGNHDNGASHRVQVGLYDLVRLLVHRVRCL